MKKRMIQVGCGGFGEYWLKEILPEVSSFTELVAAVDINPEALKNAERYMGLSGEKCYTDLRRAIAENEADFVNVVVPMHMHEAVIDAAFEAGLDVVCEKPLGHDMEACLRICRKAGEMGRKLVVTMSHRFEVEKQTVENMARSGKYGKINYVVSRLAMKRTAGLDGKTEKEAIISNGLIHNIDTVRGICGSNVKRVYAECWTGLQEVSNAPSVLVIMEMENGIRAVLEESFANGSSLDGWSNEYLRVECADATIVADHRRITVRSDMGYPYPREEQMPLMEGEYWDHALMIREFADWLDGGNTPATWYGDNIQCCAAVFAAIESARTGQAVQVQEYLEKVRGQI
ncbi:MAG TPA: Gfo/Idh/MocA family oxidoreductase [Candidatus Eisenbergiella merdavium]|uniref:Gfo/Idh/MocA family oxidoreductase n=1 Tax=Candidatus Eisenbergiella merdavium TaxID=2838551 RepID=A0A9D2NJA0_9FIRM|nr:Gfo/Idh/MocA family oxidoreductase [Candidatus Eisenbergiella merdavium]